MKRLVVIPVIVLLALVAGTGCGNAYVFDQHAQKLEREWQQEQAVGVSAAELAPLRTQLAGLQARRMGPVPTSNALVGDPFARLEQQTRQVHGEAVNRSRGEAQTALQSLKQAFGPTPFTEDSADQQQLAKASEPGQLQQLARTWTQHAASVAQARDQLAGRSGGLSNGLPTDIMTGLDQVQRDVDQAGQLDLWTAPGEGAVQGASTYLSQSYDTMLSQHDATAKQLQDAASTLQQRMTLKRSASGLLQQLQPLLQYGQGTDASTRADKARQDVSAAKNDSQLNTAVSELQSVVNDLKQKRAAAQTAQKNTSNADSSGCIPNAPGKVIIVHLATQQLTAYDSGCPVLTSLVTTGQAALPTDRGTFHIFAKYPKYKMVSPWPKGNPYWYPDTYVYNAMEFVNDGTFIHSASWQPANGYGPGSQNGPFASHGCVHVPDDQLQKLFDWADIGTTVTVTN